MLIKLNTIEDVKSFVDICGRFSGAEIDVKQGRQIIDGKSILGIFSLNLLETLDVDIDVAEENLKSNFCSNIQKWEITDRI